MKKSELAQLAAKYFRAKDAAKKAYDRADRLLLEISHQIEPGDYIVMSPARKAILMDNFANKEIVWGHGGVRKYSLEVEEV